MNCTTPSAAPLTARLHPKRLLPLLALLSGSALALTPLLKPVPLSEACERAGYAVWADTHGQPRLLRHRVNFPDNIRSLAQYYDEAGRLLTLRASFSGFAGQMYDLTARLDGKGNIISERGYRRQGDRTDLKALVVDVKGVLRGKCPA